jgi:tetratricopeptide (TPR) repeat protein
MKHFIAAPLLVLALTQCSSIRGTFAPEAADAEVVSLVGESLRDLPIAPDVLAMHQAAYDAAKARLANDPNDADALIALGRRAGAMGRVREALATFERGVRQFPNDPRMLRHLGHRQITARRFADAEATLERAAEMVQGQPDQQEPALVPNAQKLDIETLQQNIYYHLALARHFQDDFDGAVTAWRECLERSNNPDSQTSGTNWLCASLLRAGRTAEAKDALRAIPANFPIVEYHAYFALCRIYAGEWDGDRVLDELGAKGEDSVDFATVAYGVGNWHYVNGRHEDAQIAWTRGSRSPMWAAFGRIGSELEVARTQTK